MSCSNCNVVIKQVSSAIKCDGCQNLIHPSCTGLTESDVIMTRGKSRAVKVVCNTCSSNMLQFKDLKDLIISLKNEFTKAVSDLKQEMSEKITILRKEIDDKLAATNNENLHFEEVLGEMNDRLSRKQNVLIFGMPEQSPALDGDARGAAEVVDASVVLKSVVPTVDVSSIRPVRLGRFNPNASRPRCDESSSSSLI